MADLVNAQITDAITQTNVKVLGEASGPINGYGISDNGSFFESVDAECCYCSNGDATAKCRHYFYGLPENFVFNRQNLSKIGFWSIFSPNNLETLFGSVH
ncbi:RebB like protein [Aphanothece sacrum FPU3]|nr:RebB family R body protein [Aphanothece sacrum]GBF85033.1 RebB like protein [Aphanothece sacrum FPU3]